MAPYMTASTATSVAVPIPPKIPPNMITGIAIGMTECFQAFTKRFKTFYILTKVNILIMIKMKSKRKIMVYGAMIIAIILTGSAIGYGIVLLENYATNENPECESTVIISDTDYS